MKVLLSAYACEPGKGSEPGVGWQWMLEIARLGHEVWVLTRANNREPIERAGPLAPRNVRFVYYDLPEWLVRLKKGLPFLQVYYAWWQWGAYHAARALHRRERFDMVHHVTFGVYRQPSFMGRLGIPFVFGPVGGGERTPFRLRLDYGLRGHLSDAARDVVNAAATWNPWLHETLRDADLVLVKTPQTGAALPARCQEKVRQVVEIGSGTPSDAPTAARQSADVRFLFVGRLLFWKGLQYGLRAFAVLLRDVPGARLTVAGAGPDQQRLQQLAARLQIDHAVEWTGWIDHAKVKHVYREHDVLLFPSLHDSSGGVVLDAMAHGLPVVCFDLGGPGVLVDDTCGIVVRTASRRAEDLVSDIAAGMKELAASPERRRALQAGAVSRARASTWAAAAGALYGPGGLIEQPPLVHRLAARREVAR
jgi:glycosyltransferase involved in cell wall biosynthesis